MEKLSLLGSSLRGIVPGLNISSDVLFLGQMALWLILLFNFSVIFNKLCQFALIPMMLQRLGNAYPTATGLNKYTASMNQNSLSFIIMGSYLLHTGLLTGKLRALLHVFWDVALGTLISNLC